MEASHLGYIALATLSLTAVPGARLDPDTVQVMPLCTRPDPAPSTG